jgi:hypothetical protein
MTTVKGSNKAAVAIFGGNGDYSVLKSLQSFEDFVGKVEPRFSIESETTEHGLTVNYAKYEYIEDRMSYNGQPNYGTHWVFIEFPTRDDALKAMWDSFSFGFPTYICVSFKDGHSTGSEQKMQSFNSFDAILHAARPHGAWGQAALITDRSLDELFHGHSKESDYYHLAQNFGCQSEDFFVINPPNLGDWKLSGFKDFPKWVENLHVFMDRAHKMGNDAEGFPRWYPWEFPKKIREYPSYATSDDYDKYNHYNLDAELFVIPEDEGGVPITDHDRLTFTDGPNEIEGSIWAFYRPITVSPGEKITLSPGETARVKIALGQASEYIDEGHRFAAKKDGKVIALGILNVFRE